MFSEELEYSANDSNCSVHSSQLIDDMLLSVLLFLITSVSTEHPERCWMNQRIDESNVAGPCPFLTRNNTFCGIEGNTEEGMTNKRCRWCPWREIEDKMCQGTDDHTKRECCCKTPMCNKQLWLDMQVGVDKDVTELGEGYENVCVYAVTRNGSWKMQKNNSKSYAYHTCDDSRPKDIPVCGIRFGFDYAKRINFVATSCVEDVSYCEVHNKDNDICWNNGTSGFTDCCCKGRLCNKELYMKYAFNHLMNYRLEEEHEYLKTIGMVAEKKMPKKLWFLDEEYLDQKTIMSGCLTIGTAFYIVLVMALFRLYRPIEMDKRPRPVFASKEVANSPS